MYIPQSVLSEYLVPADYDKPKIEIRNYYLKWNAESYGTPQKEINELKKFLTNAIPFSGTSYHNCKKNLSQSKRKNAFTTFESR